MLDLLFGSAYHRLLQGHRPLSDQFARHVVDLIVAGVTAQRPNCESSAPSPSCLTYQTGQSISYGRTLLLPAS